MTRVGISITKSSSFRNATQEWSNVYYYDGLLGVPSQADAAALIDQAANREKVWHSTNCTFVRGRLWTETGNKATNEMIDQHNLSGTGSSTSGVYDKERAHLFRLRAGVDSRGNPVYLRKWYHVCGNFGSAGAPSGNVIQNTSGFSQSERDAQVGVMNNIGSIGSGATLGTLCAKSGRQPTAGQTWQAHQFLEHHQLGDMWRAQ
jgi:hypothetical protein